MALTDETIPQSHLDRDLEHWDRTHLVVDDGPMVVVSPRRRRKTRGRLIPVFSPDVWDSDLEMEHSVRELRIRFEENLPLALGTIAAGVLASKMPPSEAQQQFGERARSIVADWGLLWRDRIRKLAAVMEQRVSKRHNYPNWSVPQSDVDKMNQVFDQTSEPLLQSAIVEFQAAAFRGLGTDKNRTPETQSANGFPNRTAWLEARLLERGWGASDPYAYGGPDRKTVQKLLRGVSVRNDVLQKLAAALSKAHQAISVLDIPKN